MRYLIILLLLLTACSPVKVKFSGSEKKYDAYAGEVRILTSFPEKKQYVKIGELNAEAALANPNEQVISTLKKEAAKRGANAIVLTQDVVTNINYNWKLFLRIYDAPKTAKATAIRIK